MAIQLLRKIEDRGQNIWTSICDRQKMIANIIQHSIRGVFM